MTNSLHTGYDAPLKRNSWRRYLICSLFLVPALGLSVFGAILTERREDVRLQELFQDYSQDIKETLIRDMKVNLQILASAADLYSASQEVTREEFNAFLKNSLSHRFAIYAMQWIPRVTDAERLEFEVAARKQGYMDFQILERDKDGKAVPAPRRTEYFPTYYCAGTASVKPDAMHHFLLGFNNASDPARKKTMEQARDRNTAIASLPLPLSGSAGKEIVIIVYEPVYAKDSPTDTVQERRRNLRGYVTEIFRTSDMVELVMEDVSPRPIDFSLYIESDRLSPVLLAFHSSRTRKSPMGNASVEKEILRHPSLVWKKSFGMAGRHWTIVCRPSPAFFDHHVHRQPWIVLILGSLISFLGARYTYVMMSRADTVQSLVQERTAELQKRTRLALFDAEIGNALVSGDTLQGTLQQCAQIIVRHLDGAFARIWTLDASTNTLVLQASAGMYTHLNGPHGRVPVGKFKIGLIAQERLPHLTNAVVGDPRVSDQEWAIREKMVAFAGYPLIVDNKLVGVVAMFARQPLDQNTLDSLSTISKELALDIERKRMEGIIRESETYNRTIIETASDAFISMDQDGRITDWNRQAELMFGWERGEALGRSVAETVIPPDLREAHAGGLARFLMTGKGPLINKLVEVTAVHKDGHDIPVELTITPIRRGDTHHFNAFVRNITDRKRAEEQREAFNRRLEELSALKNEFVATVSHELRSPLAAIKEELRLVLDGLAGPVSKPQGDFLGKACKNIERLTNLINNLLDISKIEAGRLRLDRKRVDMQEVIEMTLDNYRALAAGRTLKTDFDGTSAVFADSNRVTQILDNLLSNAIKFTKENGTITVRTKEREGVLAVSVADDGIGMWKEDLARLFQKFSQVGQTEGKPKGTGLGLALCKNLVEMQGGVITVESKPKQGTTFTFTLPAYAPAVVLQESFKDALDSAKSVQKSTLGLLAFDMDPFLAFLAPGDLVQRRAQLDDLAGFVRKQVDHNDVVFSLDPRWVVVLSPAEPGGISTVAARVRKCLEESADKLAGQRVATAVKIKYGKAMYPTDDIGAQGLFAKATAGLA